MLRFSPTVRALMGAGCLAIGVSSASAEIAKPNSIDLLFEKKHLTNVEPGTELVYRFQRTVSKPEILGEAFSDDIKVDVRKAAANGNLSPPCRV